MKISFISICLILFLSLEIFAGTPFTEFKIGIFDPKDVNKRGYLFGINLGRMIDESLSWSFEFNYFQRGYNNTKSSDEIQTPTGGSTVKEKSLEFTTRIIPVFAKLNYEHPLGYRSPIYARASAGLGWEMVWNEEQNWNEENKHENRFFHGFGWQGSAGIGFEISSSANLFADVFYNGSKVKRNEETTDEGFLRWEEMDISGWGMRFGVSIVGFGW